MANNKVTVLSWEDYYHFLSQGKISTKHQKTQQEIEAEKLMNECIAAVESGKPFC